MNPDAKQALEAILFVVDEPVDVSTLSQILEVGRVEVEAELHRLATELEEEGRGFVLRRVAGGWRFYTAADAAPYVERWVRSGRSARLSQAALETLAVVAYKQPITRQEVSDVRGVNADAALRTLVSRDLVEEVGRDTGPGQAILYGTTRAFLEKLGLGDLDELPPLTDFLPEGPAPDEPYPGDLREARSRLQEGRELAATGGPRWDPGGADTGDEPPATPADADARRAAEGEMDDLTDALERAARNAMATLDQAVRATEADDDGAAGTAPGDESDA